MNENNEAFITDVTNLGINEDFFEEAPLTLNQIAEINCFVFQFVPIKNCNDTLRCWTSHLYNKKKARNI